jgi:hypothetical protein
MVGLRKYDFLMDRIMFAECKDLHFAKKERIEPPVTAISFKKTFWN